MRTNPFPIYLTKSRVRADLLTLFFLNPGESRYFRELERQLGYAVGPLARELKRFSKEGLLLRESRGKEVFYHLNQNHPLFHEIKGIVEKTQGIPVRLSEGLRPIKSIQQAYLYGSFAKGNAGANSDIDLLFVGEETPALRKFLKNLERRFGRTINVNIYPPREFEGKRKNRSEFLFEVMRGPLIQLKPQPPIHGSHSAT